MILGLRQTMASAIYNFDIKHEWGDDIIRIFILPSYKISNSYIEVSVKQLQRLARGEFNEIYYTDRLYSIKLPFFFSICSSV